MRIKYAKPGRPAKKMQAAKAFAEKILEHYQPTVKELFDEAMNKQYHYAHWDSPLPSRFEGDGIDDYPCGVGGI